jgi:ubiquinone/menaquinone biosynthesis C-methylase UbiE
VFRFTRRAVLEVGYIGVDVRMRLVSAAKRGLHVTGIDISSRALFLLKNRVKAMRLAHKVDLVLGDVTALPIGSEVFDAAVCSSEKYCRLI